MGNMTKDDYLHIFRRFWTEEGYAGIQPHLPTWSKSRASNFAFRHGIKMTAEAKTRRLQAMAEDARNTRKANHINAGRYPESTTENRLLMGKW